MTMHKRLPDAELAVMQALWACEAPAKRAQIALVLEETHPMAPTTLLTLLSRLAEKGFVKIEKNGKSAVYAPLVARKAYLSDQNRSFRDRLFGRDLPAFAQALTDSGLSADEIELLRDLLKKDAL